MILQSALALAGSFRKKVVLVTGASSGIGRETAIAFARKGAAVGLAARRRHQLEEVAEAVTDAGGRPLILPTDVTNPQQVRACIATVRRKWNRIDVLVNNAGVLVPSTLAELPSEALQTMMQVNVFGAFHMMQAVLPIMQAQENGAIVNVASLAGRRGITPLGGYCATKFALVGLTEALRSEVPSKIHVGLILPGVVDTPMVEQVEQRKDLPQWPEILNMPVEWVAAAILLCVRFRLLEVSVPPGAATLELLAALVPRLGDTFIRSVTAAGQFLGGRSGNAKRRPAPRPRPARRPSRRT